MPDRRDRCNRFGAFNTNRAHPEGCFVETENVGRSAADRSVRAQNASNLAGHGGAALIDRAERDGLSPLACIHCLKDRKQPRTFNQQRHIGRLGFSPVRTAGNPGRISPQAHTVADIRESRYQGRGGNVPSGLKYVRQDPDRDVGNVVRWSDNCIAEQISERGVEPGTGSQSLVCESERISRGSIRVNKEPGLCRA